MQDQGEIILYQPDETVRLEVKLEGETVWLTQAQMSELFLRDQSVIARHIRNIFNEKELDEKSNMHFLHIAFSDKPVKVYNLDVIISVGYRVKSLRGTQFRQWANSILKEYLLKGYAVHQRIDQLEKTVARHGEQIDFFVRTSLPPVEGVFYDGQLFDAYAFATKLIRSAKKSIVLIDNYIDESVLLMLGKRRAKVSALIYTAKITRELQLDLDRYNTQYPPITMEKYSRSHDRFLIIDDKEVYHIGASLKDLGKKLFAFSLLHLVPETVLRDVILIVSLKVERVESVLSFSIISKENHKKEQLSRNS